MDIKEIALKVADSLRNKIDGISHMQSNQGLVRFVSPKPLSLKSPSRMSPLGPFKTESFSGTLMAVLKNGEQEKNSSESSTPSHPQQNKSPMRLRGSRLRRRLKMVHGC